MKWILRNQTILPRGETAVDIDDRGYQFGDGIYEVVRLYGGEPFLMRPHLDRLRRSAHELGMRADLDNGVLEENFRQLAEKEGVSTGILYMQVTRGVYQRVQEFPPADLPVQLTAYAKPMERPAEALRQGVAVWLVPDIRWLRCDIKSLNLIPNVMARQQAKEHNCLEALQHRGDMVTEGAFSNVFLVSGGKVRTHPEGNLILSGITRAHVLSLCEQAKISVDERAFSVNELLSADEVFITSTSNEVMPVVRVGDAVIGTGEPGPVTRNLQGLYEESFGMVTKN